MPRKFVVRYINLKMVPGLKILVDRAAKRAQLPANEWVVRMLAERIFQRPTLGQVPRRRPGRKSRALVGARNQSR